MQAVHKIEVRQDMVLGLLTRNELVASALGDFCGLDRNGRVLQPSKNRNPLSHSVTPELLNSRPLRSVGQNLTITQKVC
jgi:hypothetical protein